MDPRQGARVGCRWRSRRCLSHALRERVVGLARKLSHGERGLDGEPVAAFGIKGFKSEGGIDHRFVGMIADARIRRRRCQAALAIGYRPSLRPSDRRRTRAERWRPRVPLVREEADGRPIDALRPRGVSLSERRRPGGVSPRQDSSSDACLTITRLVLLCQTDVRHVRGGLAWP